MLKAGGVTVIGTFATRVANVCMNERKCQGIGREQ